MPESLAHNDRDRRLHAERCDRSNPGGLEGRRGHFFVWRLMITAVLLGLVIGSFLNVVIARVPASRSLWKPGSACPGCGAAIAWHDNIPLVSFVALRGRCRRCGIQISWRYPLVEAATAVLFALAYVTFGPTADGVVAAIFLAALLSITVIDLEHQIIPDVITLPGILTGFIANVATGRIPWLDSLLGIFITGGIFWIIAEASAFFMRQEGMGGGDIKLGAMLGAFLGWKVALLSVFLSVVVGGTLAVVLIASGIRGRKDPIPFGPFLAAGGAVSLFWGERMVRWYLSGFAA
jgi:leader peptidase (prepilin peptidase) / N-methyltransferase